MTTMKNWKLMDDAITQEQREKLSDFCLNSDRFSQGEEVRKFEEQWSKWQGCKYSVFCNSGSSANFLMVQAARELWAPHPGATWVSQACTWATTVSPIMLSGDNLQLCDVSIPSLGPDKKNLEQVFKEGCWDGDCPRYLFLAHLLGFPAIDDEILQLCEYYGVTLLEDCCESHGATFKGTKIGNFGDMSSFSFYYGHHMTTIEGGMVCTNHSGLYEKLLLLRSHGLLRELPKEAQEDYKDMVVDDNFTFMLPGYNMRSTDFNAVLGQMQLKDLDKHNDIRIKNFDKFASTLDPEKYHADFRTEGNCSFCFPVITKNGNVQDIRKTLEREGVETRPIIAGNLYRHPFMNRVNQKRFDTNAELVHQNGFYIGNNHSVRVEDVDWLTDLLNKN
tara:strand:- start:304 stop:1473 length:1170 start_codon:yes stop_codon:yes gene_type:complete